MTESRTPEPIDVTTVQGNHSTTHSWVASPGDAGYVMADAGGGVTVTPAAPRRPAGITAGELIEQLKKVDPDALVIYHDDFCYRAAGAAEATVIGVDPNSSDWTEEVDKVPDWDNSFRGWAHVPGVILVEVQESR